MFELKIRLERVEAFPDSQTLGVGACGGRILGGLEVGGKGRAKDPPVGLFPQVKLAVMLLGCPSGTEGGTRVVLGGSGPGPSNPLVLPVCCWVTKLVLPGGAEGVPEEPGPGTVRERWGVQW